MADKKYKLHYTGSVSIKEGKHVGTSFDPNVDSEFSTDYTLWKEQGNVPDPADPAPDMSIDHDLVKCKECKRDYWAPKKA